MKPLFISYSCRLMDGREGRGSTVLEYPKPLDGGEALAEVSALVAAKDGVRSKDLVIMFYRRME